MRVVIKFIFLNFLFKSVFNLIKFVKVIVGRFSKKENCVVVDFFNFINNFFVIVELE